VDRRLATAALEFEIAQEKASALGRLGRGLETTLSALRAFDAAHIQVATLSREDRQRRDRLVANAAQALWLWVTSVRSGSFATIRLAPDSRPVSGHRFTSRGTQPKSQSLHGSCGPLLCALAQQRPNPADEGRHEQRVGVAWQRRRSWQQLLAPEDSRGSDDEQDRVTRPRIRIGTANSLGILTRRRAVAHREVPAANAGTLPAGPAAVPESRTPSPIAKTRKPLATTSFPVRKYLMASNAEAITIPAASIAHSIACTFCWATMAPARPNAPPSARPTAAMMFIDLGIVSAECAAAKLLASSADRLLLPRLPTSCCIAANSGSVPELDSCTAAKQRSFDHLVGNGEQPGRKSQGQRFRGSQIDHELKLRRLHDGQVGGLLALENSAYGSPASGPNPFGARRCFVPAS
jgi:hypothetical protein